MSWSAHQQALLREIGVRLWLPPTMPATPVEQAEPAAQAPAVILRMPVAAAPISVDRPGLPPPMPSPKSSPRSSHLAVDADAEPGSVAAMDWNSLQAAVSTCRACSLCDSRRQTVFGVGHQQARVMLVGEAPGEQEDRDGEPFVGKAGQLLDNMLRSTRLTRAEADADRQVYIANVLKCRPPQNRNPLPEEVAKCEPYLRRQVALVQPEVIIAMGRFAVQSLLASQEPIGRLRGRVHEFAGIPVVVTYHPAYLLRNPLDKSRSWEDLCLAREVLGHRSPGAA